MGEDSVVGPYRLVELLGRGGMGSVFHAWDTRRERDVALKLLHPDLADDAGYRARFARESRLAARLSSPHVIPIHDFGELESGQLYLDMRLCRGRDLGSIIADEGALPPARAVEIVSQLADALDAAHASGLVHRDVKPANTLVETSGERDFVYLVDFGIVRSLHGDLSASLGLTGTGSFLGTLPYMAPETFEDGVAVTAAVDVYALGCVLHEALTGARAFSAGSPAGLIHQHLATTPSRVSELAPGLPLALDDVVGRALAKRPGERWGSAPELARAAQQALSGRAPAPMRVRWDDPARSPVEPRDAVVEVPGAIPSAPTRVPEADLPTSGHGPPVPDARDTPSRRRRPRVLAAVGVAAAALLVGGGVLVATLSGSSAPTSVAASSAPASAPSGPVIPAFTGAAAPDTDLLDDPVLLLANGALSTRATGTTELLVRVGTGPSTTDACRATVQEDSGSVVAADQPCDSPFSLALSRGTHRLSAVVNTSASVSNNVTVTVD